MTSRLQQTHHNTTDQYKRKITNDAGYSKPRPTSHCRMLSRFQCTNAKLL